MEAHEGCPRVPITAELETSRLANQQCILSFANKQLSGTAFLC